MSYAYSLPRSGSQGQRLDLDYTASLPRDRRQQGGKGSVNNIDSLPDAIPLTTARSGELIEGGSLKRRTLDRARKSTRGDRDQSGNRTSGSRGSSIDRQLSDYEPTCATLERRQRSTSNSRQNSVNGHLEFSGALDDAIWDNWNKTFQQLDQDLKRGGMHPPPMRRNKFDKFGGADIALERNSTTDNSVNQNGFLGGRNSWARHSAREYTRPSAGMGGAKRPQYNPQINRMTANSDSLSSRASSSSMETRQEDLPRDPRLAQLNGRAGTTGSSNRGYASDSEESMSWIERQRSRINKGMPAQNIKTTTKSGSQFDENNNREWPKTTSHTSSLSRPPATSQDRRGRSEVKETSSQRSYSFTSDQSPGRFRFQSLPRKSKRSEEDVRNSKYNDDIHKYMFEDEESQKLMNGNIGSGYTSTTTSSMKRSGMTGSDMNGGARRSNSTAAADRLKQLENQQRQQQNTAGFFKSYDRKTTGSSNHQEPDDYIEISLQPIGVKHLEPQEPRSQPGSRTSTLQRSSTLNRTSTVGSGASLFQTTGGASLPRSHSSASRIIDNRSRDPSSDRTYTIRPESYLRKPGAYTAQPEPYVEQSAKHWSGVSTLPTGVQPSWMKASADFDPRWQTLQDKRVSSSTNQKPSSSYTTSTTRETKSSHYLNPDSLPARSVPVQFGSDISPPRGAATDRGTVNTEIHRPIPISPNLSKGNRHQYGTSTSSFSEFSTTGSRNETRGRTRGGGSATPEGAIREYLRSQEVMMNQEINKPNEHVHPFQGSINRGLNQPGNSYKIETTKREIKTVGGQPFESTERKTYTSNNQNREREIALADLESFLGEFDLSSAPQTKQQGQGQITSQLRSSEQSFNQQNFGANIRPGGSNPGLTGAQPVRVVDLQANKQIPTTASRTLPASNNQNQNGDFDYQEPMSSRSVTGNTAQNRNSGSAHTSYSSSTFNHQTSGPFQTRYEESRTVSSFGENQIKPNVTQQNFQSTGNNQTTRSSAFNRPVTNVANNYKNTGMNAGGNPMTQSLRPTAFHTHTQDVIPPGMYVVEQRQQVTTNYSNNSSNQPVSVRQTTGSWRPVNTEYNQMNGGMDSGSSIENSFDRYSTQVDDMGHSNYQTFNMVPRPPPSNSSMDSNQSPHSLELESRFREVQGRGFSPAAHSSPSVSVDRSSAGSLESSRDGIEPVSQGPYSVKFVRDISNMWYKPEMPREQIVSTLKTMQPGSFIVRDSSSYPGSYALAIKVAEIPSNIQSRDVADEELVRHFLIEPTPKGVRLKGYKAEPVFGSLAALVYQHTLTAIALPCKLLLPSPGINHMGYTSSQPSNQLMNANQGATVLFLNSSDTGLLTGPEAVERTASAALNFSSPQTSIVQLTVSNDGVTITDNERRLFFRRHYPLRLITYCGFDRNQRRWNGKLATNGQDISARIFGLVSRKLNNPMSNECHIFAELVANEGDSLVETISRAAERNSTGVLHK